jgi:TnpA family transposase
MLKRLGAYPRQNGLALALREIDRIEWTRFTLDWLDMPALRRQVAAEPNKSEARNAVAYFPLVASKKRPTYPSVAGGDR